MNWTNIDFEKVLLSPFVVGLAGAVVALKGCPGNTWAERLFNASCGALLAGFVSAAIAEWLGLKTPEMRSAIAFMTGLFGMNLVASINIVLHEIKLSDVLPWFKRG